jgi:hypothetical protein
MKTLTLSIFAILISYISCEIRFVMNFITHGAKAPSEEFINEYNEDRFGELWTEPNELTAIGMRSQYLLGTRSRLRYDNFIKKNFDPNQVIVKSSHYNATLMSAEAHLQGLYPQPTGPNLSGYQRNVAYPPQGKTGYGSFNQENFGAPALPFNTQVFPVEVFSAGDYDYFVLYDVKDNCQDYYFEIIDNKQSNTTKDWLKDFSEKYGDQLQSAVMFEDKAILQDYHFTYTLLQDFISDYVEGKLLKRLTDKGINLKEFNDTATEFMNYNLYTTMNSGEKGLGPNTTFTVFANEFSQYMDRRIQLDVNGLEYLRYPEYDNGEPNPKMLIYAVSPTTVASLMKYMEKEMNTKLYYIPYSSILSFEFKRLDGKDNTALTEFDYFVDIIFNDIPLKTVSYANFKEILDNAKSMTRIRWDCSLSPWEFWGFKNATVTLIVCSGILFIGCIIALACCCSKDRKNKRLIEEHNRA